MRNGKGTGVIRRIVVQSACFSSVAVSFVVLQNHLPLLSSAGRAFVNVSLFPLFIALLAVTLIALRLSRARLAVSVIINLSISASLLLSMAISSIAGAAASPVLVLIALAQAGAGYVTGFAPLSEYLPRSKPQDYIRHALIASACLGGTIAVFQSVYIVSASLLSLSDISAPFSIAAPLLPVLVLCISLLAVALASAFRIDYREIDRSEDCEIVRHTPSAVQIAVAATFFAMMLFSFGIAYAHNYDSLPQTGYAVLFTGLAALAFTPLFWQLAKNRKIQTTFYLCAVVIGISLALQIGLGGSISNYIIDGLILAWLPFSLVYVYELAGRKDADAVTVGSASIPLLLFAGSTVARFFGGTGPLIIGATIIAFSVVFAAALPHVETRLSESDEMRDYLEAAKREKGSLD